MSNVENLAENWRLNPQAMCAGLLSLALSVSGRAQQAPLEKGQGAPVVERTVQPSQVLGPDDLVELSVTYCPELNHSFRIDSEGELALPLLSKPIHAAGLTPAQLARQLRQSLQQQEIIVDPVVSVSALEYRSRPVSIVGAVNQPLTFQATGTTTLLDAIARAGGLRADAGANILITRTPSAAGVSGPAGVQVVATKALIAGSDAAAKVLLHGGEQISVPEASKIFVAGNVRRPGMYAIQGDADMTVIKAITLSSGLDQFSAHKAYIYRQAGKPGSDRTQIDVELDHILSHKSPDVLLLADDILYVPTSNGKRLTSHVLNQISGFGQAAGTGLIIYK